MTSRSDALAGLAEDVGNALLLFAERLRAVSDPTAGSRGLAGATRGEEGLGASQLKVLEAVRESGASGVTSHQVAKLTDLANSNTPRILQALARRGLVEASNGKPAIWRSVSHD